MALASQDAASTSAGADGPEPPVRAPSTTRRKLNPTKLGYLIGPVAFAVILLLMRFGYVARVRWWVWLALLVGIAIVNAAADRYYPARPGRMSLNLRVASQVTAVTLAIYLTGWGPVLWAAYIFVALENLARAGSRVWRTTVLCSLIGMTFGQFSLARGWLPSELQQVRGRLAHRHGRLRPLLRHPDGRRHHGAERDGDGAEGGGRDAPSG